MKTADEILHEHDIAPPPPGKHRYYTTCPQCSAKDLRPLVSTFFSQTSRKS